MVVIRRGLFAVVALLATLGCDKSRRELRSSERPFPELPTQCSEDETDHNAARLLASANAFKAPLTVRARKGAVDVVSQIERDVESGDPGLEAVSEAAIRYLAEPAKTELVTRSSLGKYSLQSRVAMLAAEGVYTSPASIAVLSDALGRPRVDASSVLHKIELQKAPSHALVSVLQNLAKHHPSRWVRGQAADIADSAFGEKLSVAPQACAGQVRLPLVETKTGSIRLSKGDDSGELTPSCSKRLATVSGGLPSASNPGVSIVASSHRSGCSVAWGSQEGRSCVLLFSGEADVRTYRPGRSALGFVQWRSGLWLTEGTGHMIAEGRIVKFGPGTGGELMVQDAGELGGRRRLSSTAEYTDPAKHRLNSLPTLPIADEKASGTRRISAPYHR